MKKAIPITIGVAAALTGAQLYVLGAKGGIGPLGFIHDNKIAAHPGNRDEYGFDHMKPMENSPLKGKRILVLGSSVAYGAASQQWAVAEYLGKRFGCDYTKEAVSGTTLCNVGPKSYVSRLKKLDTSVKYDLFICQLSTNDARTKRPLGEIGCGDAKTVTGAIEFIVDYVKKTWGCPVLFFTGSRYESAVYAAMVERLMELSRLHGFGVLDLWHSDSFNTLTEDKRKLYMNDPIHPTKAGYRDWWGPELEKQLLAYLGEQG